MATGPFLRTEYTALHDNKMLLADGFIAPSPGAAVARIRVFSGGSPNRFGDNSEDIAIVRDRIGRLGLGDHILNALVVVAPHTHWGIPPVICSFEKDHRPVRYKIGPDIGKPPYSAISFAFSRNGPVPYEWADSTCEISPEELVTLWDTIQIINSAITAENWFFEGYPLGVSIHHKFKSCFAAPEASSHETPEDDGEPFSYIYLASSLTEEALTSADQVGWSVRPPPQLNDIEILLLRDLEKYLAVSRNSP